MQVVYTAVANDWIQRKLRRVFIFARPILQRQRSTTFDGQSERKPGGSKGGGALPLPAANVQHRVGWLTDVSDVSQPPSMAAYRDVTWSLQACRTSARRSSRSER